MNVNKIGLWLANLCVSVEEGRVPLSPEVGVTPGPFLLCVLPLLPPTLLWGSPLSAVLPRPHTLPSFPKATWRSLDPGGKQRPEVGRAELRGQAWIYVSCLL